MTKQATQTGQHISKPQEHGRTESSEDTAPRSEPLRLTRREALRREYKQHYGFKPCGLSEEELARAVESAKQKDASRTSTTTTNWAKMGDVVRDKS